MIKGVNCGSLGWPQKKGNMKDKIDFKTDKSDKQWETSGLRYLLKFHLVNSQVPNTFLNSVCL